jgi:hypothetical protein
MEEEDVEMDMEIGSPTGYRSTDVKHVTQIGLDGSASGRLINSLGILYNNLFINCNWHPSPAREYTHTNTKRSKAQKFNQHYTTVCNRA